MASISLPRINRLTLDLQAVGDAAEAEGEERSSKRPRTDNDDKDDSKPQRVVFWNR